MQELRLVAVSEDGSYLVLATVGRGTRFTLPIDDRLRAVVRGHFSRLGQYEIEVESPLRPKEIQARIRAGETAEEIAETAGIPVERVRWFEGPVLQEREYMAQQAQRVTIRRPGEPSPGPALGEIVEERLGRRGIDLEEVEWDSRKCEDSTWRVSLAFYYDGRPYAAEWSYDPRRRNISAVNDEAARLSSLELDESVDDTVTPFVPRRAMKVVTERPREEPARPSAPVAVPAPPRSDGGQAGRPTVVHDVTKAPADTRRPTATPAPPDEIRSDAPAGSREAPKAAPPERPTPAAERSAPADRPDHSDRPEPASRPASAERASAGTDRGGPAATVTGPAGTESAPAETADPATAETERPAPKPAEAKPRPSRPAAHVPAPAKPAARQPAQYKTAERGSPEHKHVEYPAETVAERSAAAAAAGGKQAAPPAAQEKRPPARKRARGKRASVPSWDEIMFGARRPE